MPFKIGVAGTIAAEVAAAVLAWRQVATDFGLSSAQIDRMASASNMMI